MREEGPVSAMAGDAQGEAEDLSDSSHEPKKEPSPEDLGDFLSESQPEDVRQPLSAHRPEPIDDPDVSDDSLTPTLSLRGEGDAGRRASRDSQPLQTTMWAPRKPLQQGQTKRKLQLANSYMLEFDQLARVLNFLLEHKELKKVSREDLHEETGLAVRQIASLVSMGSAMGLIQPATQILTPIGQLIAEHDIFIEKKGTLEWCHYAGAGSFSNLVWFEVFNRLLIKDSPLTMKDWTDRLRSDLAGQYTEATLKKHLQKEVRFVADAYFERNFRKLDLLHYGPEEVIYLRRYPALEPLVLSAMIYDFCEQRRSNLFQVSELAESPGSPALLFGLDISTFRNLIEGLHERGFLRYETTHNLDQIRIKPSLSVHELLLAHFEGRSPREQL
ncbi:DUF4007 family protein [Desulfoferrobacter suflitae]|uniref:DUF4007 family protein n=1 Tax=Desulfoferrobacter suflitae TaxID=2865782 RepID=UPI0021648947|nr:DUF4007 family protein [Desulfoferrobacter suflitae]MCK8601985.1 DUF4007 family protein [Desulfoferrobacter suflitae]